MIDSARRGRGLLDRWWFPAAWVTVVIADLAAQPLRAARDPGLSDLSALNTGAWLLRHGMPDALYSVNAQQGAQAAVVGHPLTVGLNPYGNPPLVAWVMQPLSALALGSAMFVVVMLSLLAVAVSTAVLAGMLPRGWGLARRVAMGLCIAASLPQVDAIAYGQLVAIVAVGPVLALRLSVRHGDAISVGLLLTTLGVKPQLVWLVLPVLVIARAWRTALGLITGAAAWIVSGVLIVGASGMVHWVRDVLPSDTVDYSTKSAGIPGLLVAAGMDHRLAFATSFVCAGVALVIAWRLRDRLRDDLPLALVVGLAASTLCSPHIWAGDLALATLGLILIAPHRPSLALCLAVVDGLAGIGIAGGHLECLAIVATIAATVMVRRETTASASTSLVRRAARPWATSPRRSRASRDPAPG